MKDHEIAQIYNTLRETAVIFHDHQALRENMVRAAKPLVDRIAELERALLRISDPVAVFIEEAKDKGYILNGAAAVELSEHAPTLKQWAREALNT